MNSKVDAGLGEVSGFHRGKGTELVVLLHAYANNPKSMEWIRTAVSNSENRAGADFYIPSLPVSVFSCADPVDIVRDLLQDIDRLDATFGYRRITLIGHSLGALLARKLYICACGENADAPFEPGLDATHQRPWAGKVDRIILMAGMNRGWSISHHMGFGAAIGLRLGVMLGTMIRWVRGRPLIIMLGRRGSPLISQLRIQWLSMLRNHKSPINETGERQREALGEITAIQLLGTVDDLVSPEDNIDLATGAGFIYLEVPRSGHANVIEMDDSEPGKLRRAVFLKALDDDPSSLRAESIQPADQRIEPDPRVKNVIFVIHGIRDYGFWTQRIARRVMDLWRKASPEALSASVTATYGYYTMLPFLLPWRRQEKVQWLVDQYTEALAKYPNADYYYVGHSNGTYLLSQALEENTSCHFKRVVFAGSVVPSAYDWQKHLTSRKLADGRATPPQVESVLNYVATRDLVVAVLPNGLGRLGVKDLGGAGHDGFIDIEAVSQVRYVRGGHSAALEEDRWSEIANFIFEGEFKPSEIDESFQPTQEAWMRLAGRFSWAFWVLLPFILVLMGFLLVQLPAFAWRYNGFQDSSTLVVIQTLFVVAYVWAVVRFVTRF